MGRWLILASLCANKGDIASLSLWEVVREDREGGEEEKNRREAAHFTGFPYPLRFTSLKAIYFYVKNNDHRTDRS